MIVLRANFTPTTKDFSIGTANFVIEGNTVYVEHGFLEDIERMATAIPLTLDGGLR